MNSPTTRIAPEADPTWLLGHRSDRYSQTGEDGVIAQILSLLPERDRWCVEFGAWDGIAYSNTRNLIQHEDYSAVMIEGSRERYGDLLKTYPPGGKVIGLHAFVGFTAADGLDVLLAATPIPRDFDLLSIDVDGNDYHIWNAVTVYRPKVVIIEFNPTVPSEVTFVQAARPDVNQGAAVASIAALGKEKGYELVALLPWNALFVDARYFPLFGITDNRVQTLRRNHDSITWLFSGYDGRVFLRGRRELPWHGWALREETMQQLPRFLQQYSGNYGRFEVTAYKLFKLCKRPLKTLGDALRRRGGSV